MIKVLKNGCLNPKTKTVYMVTCSKCGCVFNCESEDFLSRERSVELHATIKCPYCEEILSLDSSTPAKTTFEEQAGEQETGDEE